VESLDVKVDDDVGLVWLDSKDEVGSVVFGKEGRRSVRVEEDMIKIWAVCVDLEESVSWTV
jgi:hypothetical protein